MQNKSISYILLLVFCSYFERQILAKPQESLQTRDVDKERKNEASLTTIQTDFKRMQEALKRVQVTK